MQIKDTRKAQTSKTVMSTLNKMVSGNHLTNKFQANWSIQLTSFWGDSFCKHHQSIVLHADYKATSSSTFHTVVLSNKLAMHEELFIMKKKSEILTTVWENRLPFHCALCVSLQYHMATLFQCDSHYDSQSVPLHKLSQ